MYQKRPRVKSDRRVEEPRKVDQEGVQTICKVRIRILFSVIKKKDLHSLQYK